MALVTRPAMADDSGDFISGTTVTKAFIDLAYDQIDDQAHSTTNPTIKPKAITDEVVSARGALLTLDARLDVSLNEDGTLKSQASLVTVAQVQTLLGSRNVILNGDFDDWAAGAALAPDDWTLNGAAATIARTGPGEADTFTFGAGKYAAKVTRVGNDANLEHVIIAAADIADYAEAKSRKVSVAVKVKTSIASHARITIDDGVTTTTSTFHTGGATAEHLTATHTISASATKLHVKLDVLSSNGAAYFGGVQAVFADSAPSDWQPISHERDAGLTRRGLVSSGAQTFGGQKTFKKQPAFFPGSGASAIGTHGGFIHVNTTQVGNVGAGEDTLMTFSLPANTLDVDGRGVRITVWGRNAANANTKRLKLRYGAAAVLFDTTAVAQNDYGWWASVVLIRTGAATQEGFSMFLAGPEAASITAADSFTTHFNHTEDNTLAQSIFMTAEATANDDVIQHGMLIEMIG